MPFALGAGAAPRDPRCLFREPRDVSKIETTAILDRGAPRRSRTRARSRSKRTDFLKPVAAEASDDRAAWKDDRPRIGLRDPETSAC